MPVESGSFWTSLPGVVTAVAGLVAAVGSLIGVLHSTGLLGRARSSTPATAAGGAPTTTADAPAAIDRERGQRERSGTSEAVPPLRSAPAVLTPANVNVMLVRLGLHDQRRNPGGRGVAHRYASRAEGQIAVVADEATGLTWEMGGSARPLPFDGLGAHVDRLNAERAAGSAAWRIPTAEEVMSLMEPAPIDGFHIAPVFQRGINLIWTADQAPGGARAWVVYFADGTVELERRDFHAWVRAVH